MVLEHLFPENWLEKKVSYAFILGASYSIIGILIASVLFPSDPALVAVAFTALLLLPELSKLFSIEERKEEKEKTVSVSKIWKDNKDFIRIYLSIAVGIFMVYAIASIILPAFQVNILFREQLAMRGAGGGAVFTASVFMDIILNNWWVLVACFLIALLTGDGAVFLITWNASMWGTIFGITARNAAIYSNTNPFWYLFLVLIIVLPHAFLEILAYILAAISGGVISKDVLKEKFESIRFHRVFNYNVWLFFFAILILIIGAFVETYVLGNIGLYKEIILQSYLA